jgi:hypothetical protein
MNDLNYQVGNKIFLNKFQAANEAYKTNQSLKFNLFETAFDQADWSKEPELSWNELLDIRAQQIASKKLPIVLSFSGGTDSYTIYKVFERNNIHIDAIFLRQRAEESEQSYYTKVFELFNSGIYDPHCEIVVMKSNHVDHELLPRIYKDRDWIWNTKERYQFGIIGGGGIDVELMQEKFGKDVIGVTGVEKPRIKFLPNGKAFSFQDDIAYSRPMMSPNQECFFISSELPELHIKQSYMLKNYLKLKYNITAATTNFDLINQHFNPTVMPWLEYSFACGRYGDLGNSTRQHIKMRETALVLPESGGLGDIRYSGQGIKLFNDFKGTDWFKNYIGGLLDVKNDGAGKFLSMNSNNLYAMKMLNSKMYELEF